SAWRSVPAPRRTRGATGGGWGAGVAARFSRGGGGARRGFRSNHPRGLGTGRRFLRGRPGGANAGACWQTPREWQAGGGFLLMTDALAQWFLHRSENGKDPLTAIRKLLAEKSPEAAFADWVEKRRQLATLRNDDVTLVVVDVE